MPRETLEERFWKKVEKHEDGCWYWRAHRVRGYGRINVSGKIRAAHVVAYEWYHGPIPPGMEIDHRCRHTDCVNPNHLEAVTHAENVRRGLRGRRHEIPQQCTNGHVLTRDSLSWIQERTSEENAFRWRCKACVREKTQRYRDAMAEGLRPVSEPPEYCANGHRLEGDNLYRHRSGWACVECRRASGRRAYHKAVRTPKILPPRPEFCVNGHAMRGANIVKTLTGWVCRTCRRAAGRRAYHKKKGQ